MSDRYGLRLPTFPCVEEVRKLHSRAGWTRMFRIREVKAQKPREAMVILTVSSLRDVLKMKVSPTAIFISS